MRDFEFRGLNAENNFVFGELFYSYSLGIWKVCRSNGWTPSYYNPDEGESTVYEEIRPETVGQYVGLKDNDGIKVYDGDIFIINDKPYFVEYINDQCKYVLTTGKGYDTPNCMDLNCDSIFGYCIKGNIHQNKELL